MYDLKKHFLIRRDLSRIYSSSDPKKNDTTKGLLHNPENKNGAFDH